MSEITGTVIKLRDFLFDVDSQITIKYSDKKHPVLSFFLSLRGEPYLFLIIKEKFAGRKKPCSR